MPQQGKCPASSAAYPTSRGRRDVSQAKDVFGDAGTAARWLSQPHTEMCGARPLDVLETQGGYERIRDLPARITHGITA
ncbi:putative toxin-antitoxin system antitoxin component (TIGR02293 family) [Paraburkholderia atlantica]|uniref:antitoxin Xre/MbcA/ParS toxin-binding domain-containing protein n=1 Tax=Paraburkholderia atlantica TaxID=2654982 RepID=UPI003D1E42BE